MQKIRKARDHAILPDRLLAIAKFMRDVPPMAQQIDQLFAKASELHRRGLLNEAHEIYRKITKSQPRNATAWQMLGITSLQLGDSEQAAKCMQSALAIDPRLPGGHYNLGVIFHKMGRLPEAVAAYSKSINSKPDDIQARLNLGAALRAQNKTQEAIDQYRKAVEIKPDFAEAHFNLGNALSFDGKHDEAIRELQRATELTPKLAPPWLAMGQALRAAGRPHEAIEKFESAAALDPNNQAVHFNLAATLSDLKKRDEAISHYNRAIAMQPDFLEAHVNLGMLHLESRNYEAAAASLNRALAIRPDAKAHFNLATLYRATERYADAFEHFDRAIKLAPEDENARAHKGLLALTLEQFSEGWDLYERRFQTSQSPMRPYPQRYWAGENVDGTLLMWGEQGLGDQIIYASMIAEMQSRASAIAIEVEPRLVPLFARSFPDLRVSALTDQLFDGDIAAHASLASIGKYLRADIRDFEVSGEKWLIPDPARTQELLDRLRDGRTVIGLSWASKNPHTQDLKSAPLLQLAPLLKLENCRFIDLQYGDTNAERTAAQDELGVTIEHLPDVDLTNDIDDLASLIAACEFVVTVSNTTAHLAGAIGTKTKVLLPHGIACPWYWFRDRTDSPWYRSLRLYRQAREESWEAVVRRVTTDLNAERPA